MESQIILKVLGANMVINIPKVLVVYLKDWLILCHLKVRVIALTTLREPRKCI
jgi:hypothetical protein